VGFLNALEQARGAGDPDAFCAAVPYARLLGMGFRELDADLLFSLPFRQDNIGNPLRPALHGGVIGAFMEHAAIIHLLWYGESRRLPKVVDFSIDYLRPGQPETTFARCTTCRQGKRVANVAVAAWQDDRERPIATARAHFLRSGGGEGPDS